jgi:hypothetical protein
MTGADLESQLAWVQANLDAEREVRQAAETERNKALALIREICQAFIPDDLDQVLREDKIEVERWNPLDYKNFIITRGITRIRRLQLLSQGDLAAELTRAQAEIKRLRGEVRAVQDLRDQLAHAQAMHNEAQAQTAARDAELASIRNEVTQLRAELAKARESTAEVFAGRPPLPESSAPEWFEQWQASAEFERDMALIKVMGYQGWCLRKSIVMALSKEGMIPASSGGTVHRLFTRMKDKWGLIEEFEPRTEVSTGRAPYLLHLTERGRKAFRLLFDQEAVESEYDGMLARHKNDEHVLLNIRARDAFLEYGAETVDLYPRPVTLPSGGTFDLDLVAVFPGQSPLYVEAERGGLKNKRQRDRKWTNYRQVTEGFYVVVPNKKVQSQIVTEITTWAYQSRTPLTLHVCNLSLLGKDGTPLWQFEREMGLPLRQAYSEYTSEPKGHT